MIAASSLTFLFVYKNRENSNNNSSSISTTTTLKQVALLDDTGSTEEGILQVIEGNNKFAFDLYNQYKNEEGNIFFSPYSISVALAMTSEGAKGKTLEEIQDVFYLPADDTIRRSSIASIFNEINKGDKKYTLTTANALWAQLDYKFLQQYFGVVTNYYGGSVTNLDFVSDTENSRLTINSWVEDQTNKKIIDLLPEGSITPDTRLVLTNAIYFKGNWKLQFKKEDTETMDFTVDPDFSKEVQMMHMRDEEVKFGYFEDASMQMLELPYEGDDLSMVIILPRENDTRTVDDNSSVQKIQQNISDMNQRNMDIYLPKFKFDTDYRMSDTLVSMGMPTAFGSEADFSGMTGSKDLIISEVIHKAYVDVNEEGTEAAAATGVVMKETAVMTDFITFKADHPFLFLIRQKESGNILFMGRVSEPIQES